MRAMQNAAERDGYDYTGNWFRTYNRDKAKQVASDYRKQGFKARVVAKGGGVAVYIKDTPKSLAMKEEQDRQDELERIQIAAEVATYLMEVAGQLKDMKLHTILSIRRDVQDVIKRGF